MVLQWDMSDQWETVLQHDLIASDSFTGVNDGYVVSLNHYLFYKFNDQWKAGVRTEWWDNDGLADDVVAMTAGVNYRPCNNLVFRPEVRFDDFGSGWNNSIRDNTTFGIDAILSY